MDPLCVLHLWDAKLKFLLTPLPAAVQSYNDGNPDLPSSWIIAPNFDRLAKKAVQFQNAYVGSMPCMPARREMHTGRYNLLHRSCAPPSPPTTAPRQPPACLTGPCTPVFRGAAGAVG